ncbi:hypothetical protein CC194727_CC194727_01756 [Campylobacter coli]|nr:hypothetical protein CC194727_CC194727_01756 [Campylobacter coli]
MRSKIALFLSSILQKKGFKPSLIALAHTFKAKKDFPTSLLPLNTATEPLSSLMVSSQITEAFSSLKIPSVIVLIVLRLGIFNPLLLL